jgi:hypothetical protein
MSTGITADPGAQYMLDVDYGYDATHQHQHGESDYEDSNISGNRHKSSENLRDHPVTTGGGRKGNRPALLPLPKESISTGHKLSDVKDDGAKDSGDEDDDDAQSMSSCGTAKRKTAVNNISFWYRLSPFMRYLIVGAVGAILFIIPAILIAVLADVSDQKRSSSILYAKYVAVDWLSWLGFMWIVSMFNHFCLDRVPRVVVKINHMLWGVCTEKIKWRIEVSLA